MKPGDAVIDDCGYHGTVVAVDPKPPYQVLVRVGKNHPQAYLTDPIPYAPNRLRLLETIAPGAELRGKP